MSNNNLLPFLTGATMVSIFPISVEESGILLLLFLGKGIAGGLIASFTTDAYKSIKAKKNSKNKEDNEQCN
jgi:hypothetical protein